MKTNRRHWIKTTSVSLASLGLASSLAQAAETKAKARAGAEPTPSFAKKAKMRLGTVTYNIAMDWDIPAIIKNCTEAKFEGVELRTTHKHGVEVTLSKAERAEVKKRFADSPVQLASLGSAYDYHTPDQAKLRQDIEATKAYIQLAHDVGATGVKVRPNALPKGVPEAKTLEQIGLSLRELGQFGAGLGQQIRLEVHGSETSRGPRCRRIMDVADHPAVGSCWNSNPTDLEDGGFDANFDLLKHRMFIVHLRDIHLEDYPFRRLFTRLNEIKFTGFAFAEIPESSDPVRVMKYFRSLWLAYQGLL